MRSQVEAHIDAPRARYDEAVRRSAACRLVFGHVLAECDIDVLITPSAPDEAPRGIESTGEALFNRNWTLLRVPCVTLPAGQGVNGLPIGVQLVAKRDDDEALLGHAYWVRRALD
jgi:Asp-tRNA(Asn)/Glu-tRNA(Gln) amidotransferase A subunit family amidase